LRTNTKTLTWIADGSPIVSLEKYQNELVVIIVQCSEKDTREWDVMELEGPFQNMDINSILVLSLLL
jgi:hypothetical protein